MLREMMKANHAHLPYSDIFTISLSEVALFQHLFYLSHRSHDNGRTRAVTMFFQEPLGFVHLNKEQSQRDDSDVKGGEGEEEDEENEELPNDDDDEIEERGAGSSDLLPPELLIPSSTPNDQSPPSLINAFKPTVTTTNSGDNNNDSSKKASRKSTLPSIRCLLFAPVHISLASLLDRKCSVYHSVGPILVMQWIQEMMLAIDYLIEW